MALDIPQHLVMRFIQDPVMAAYAMMGAELDVCQAARLRMMWFCPQFIDDSGVSMGKTEVVFIFACLRAMLLPIPGRRRVISVYYQSIGTAKETFWPKFEYYRDKSEFFKSQLKIGRGGKYGTNNQHMLEQEFINGSLIQLPAGDFANDSKNQASKRFHDLIVDEAKEIDKISRGLDKQLLDRATAPRFNKNHPIHANHTVLMGHAEDPQTHPFYKRIKVYKRMIKDGSQDHAIMTSCFRDYSSHLAKLYRDDKRIRDAKMKLSTAEFEQQWEGLWSNGSKDWYNMTDIKSCYVKGLRPELRSVGGGVRYVIGWDTAPGMGIKADLNAGVIYSLREISMGQAALMTSGVLYENDRAFIVKLVYGIQIQGLTADQISGLLHKLDMLFNFERIVMDPGGGGVWVYKKMVDQNQFIDNQWVETRGLCSIEDSGEHMTANPKVCFFKRGDLALNDMWDRNSLIGDEGILEEAHRHMSRAFSKRSIQIVDLEQQPDGSWSTDEVRVYKDLEEICKQYNNISVVTNKAGTEVMHTKRGFLRFVGKGKKDGAMSGIYGYMGIMSLIKCDYGQLEDEDDSCVGALVAG